MRCAWDSLLTLLTPWLRSPVDKQGRDTLQELRLRRGFPPELILQGKNLWLDGMISGEDIHYCINSASRYSPWSVSSVKNGYITARGGHRIGICGSVTLRNGEIQGIESVSSLCVRIARDFPGIAQKADHLRGSVLIIGAPGSGKTTLLRDLLRRRSEQGSGSVAVVDEKGELFPTFSGSSCFYCGRHTDILTGCSKPQGIEMALRNMSPKIIAVDEITAAADCDALLQAGWCGVDLFATAHAGSKKELCSRPVYRPILTSGLFDYLMILQPDKSWKLERMERCSTSSLVQC